MSSGLARPHPPAACCRKGNCRQMPAYVTIACKPTRPPCWNPLRACNPLGKGARGIAQAMQRHDPPAQSCGRRGPLPRMGRSARPFSTCSQPGPCRCPCPALRPQPARYPGVGPPWGGRQKFVPTSTSGSASVLPLRSAKPQPGGGGGGGAGGGGSAQAAAQGAASRALHAAHIRARSRPQCPRRTGNRAWTTSSRTRPQPRRCRSAEREPGWSHTCSIAQPHRPRSASSCKSRAVGHVDGASLAWSDGRSIAIMDSSKSPAEVNVLARAAAGRVTVHPLAEWA
jgi:hypothetical protein